MLNEIISMAMNNGIWAALFCLLFLYEIKDSRRREGKYQDTVSKLTGSLEIVRDIEEDCFEVKLNVDKLKDDCGKIKHECREIKETLNKYSS